MTPTLKDMLQQAREGDYAIGHFNFADSITLHAIAEACQKEHTPIFVGTSEGEAEFLGYQSAVALRDALRATTGLPVFLNADHHKSFAHAKVAIDAGYDSVQIDGTELSREENEKISKQVVEYARSVNPTISVEGELGYIRGSSELLAENEDIELRPEDLTSPEEAEQFVARTGVDRLAVVIGNIHGISVKGNPRLDIKRLREIHEAIPDVPLILHGGSGIADDDIRASLSLGMSNVHVNTDIRIAFSDVLRKELQASDGTTPYKYFQEPRNTVARVVGEKLRLFGASGIAR